VAMAVVVVVEAPGLVMSIRASFTKLLVWVGAPLRRCAGNDARVLLFLTLLYSSTLYYYSRWTNMQTPRTLKGRIAKLPFSIILIKEETNTCLKRLTLRMKF
jgi:hypothetical protein